MLQYLNDSFRRTRRYGAVIADKYLFEIFGIHTVDILFRIYQAAYLNLIYLLWKRSENEYAVDIGIIIETPGFLLHLSGFQNLKLLASLRKIANDHTIRDTIELVGLDPNLKKPVGKYSLGMRQRLGLAQALMEDPNLLILDEPLNGLDKNGVLYIRELIKNLRYQGKTVILASHNQMDIDELCDTVCEMDAGVLTVVR